MCCLKWHKTYSKVVSLAPNALEYLAQVKYDKGIWLIISAVGGNASPGQGGAASWSIPVHQKWATGEWRIVAPHQDYSDDNLQLEIKLSQDTAQFRLVNKLVGVTLEWLNVSLLVLSQDDPIIQELSGVGSSQATEYYLPPEGAAEVDLTDILARISALELRDSELEVLILENYTNLNNQLELERQARLALMSRVVALETSYWEPVTNGDAASPEIIFADGDVVMTKVTA